MIIPCRWCQTSFDSAKNIKYCSRDCHRLAVNARNRERYKRPEVKEKRAISDAIRNADPEVKARRREQQKRYESRPEIRERVRERCRARMSQPEYLAEYKKKMHARKSDPAYRARRKELRDARKNGLEVFDTNERHTEDTAR